jgi:hypothetical protein
MRRSIIALNTVGCLYSEEGDRFGSELGGAAYVAYPASVAVH